MKKFIIYTDGASRGNPGLAAASFVLKSEEGLILAQQGIFLGLATNNEAEYQAVVEALKLLKKNFSANLPAEIEIRGDSQLIIQQLLGKFKVKNERLRQLYLQVRSLEKGLGEISYTYVPRAENYLADKVANHTLNQHSFG